MPAFTFEKISPPRHHAQSASPSHAQPTSQGVSQHSVSPQPRDNVIQVLGRFVIARVREDQPSTNQK